MNLSVLTTIKALTSVLERNIGVIVTNKDITEGFERPCFYIDVDEISVIPEGEIILEEQQFSIYYFGEFEDKGYLELLKLKQTLDMIFTAGIQNDEGKTIIFDNLDFDINRTGMFLRIKLSTNEFYYEDGLDSDKETMKDLNLKTEVI